MRKLRKCDSTHLNTGISKCPVDFGRMKGAIIVHSGHKLPADLAGEKLEELCHAAVPDRAYGIVTFAEYAPEGGEAQTSEIGYGGVAFTGYSNRTDTYTLNAFDPALHASLTRNANQKRDVYFFDEDGVMYGINDGSDTLAGFPMNAIYSNATPHPTSSEKSTMTVSFAYSDTKGAIENYDFVPLGFDPLKYVLGLVGVKLEKTSTTGNAYKLFEAIGGNDLTSEYGPLIANSSTSLIAGSTTAISYDSDTDTITIAASTGVVPRLKTPDSLYEAGVKGIEQV